MEAVRMASGNDPEMRMPSLCPGEGGRREGDVIVGEDPDWGRCL